jgi:hypothetical protein
MATPTNLPAAAVSGEILTAAYVNNLRGAFRILQVVSTSAVPANVSSSNTTQVTTNLTATITPQSSSSKILVMTSQAFDKSAGNPGNGIRTQLMRNIGGTIVQLTNIGLTLGYTGTAMYLSTQASHEYLDSPATTSAITYYTSFANIAVAAEVIANVGNNCSITLMEVSA